MIRTPSTNDRQQRDRPGRPVAKHPLTSRLESNRTKLLPPVGNKMPISSFMSIRMQEPIKEVCPPTLAQSVCCLIFFPTDLSPCHESNEPAAHFSAYHTALQAT